MSCFPHSCGAGLSGRHLPIDWISETNKLDLSTLADRANLLTFQRVIHLSFGKHEEEC